MDAQQSSHERENEDRRFQLLVNAITDYAIYMLDAKGTVASWNSGAQQLKAYTAQEILGHHFSAFYTPEDQAAGIPALALETAVRNGRYEAEGWRVRKDGKRFFANVLIEPIHDEQGHLIGFAKVTRDITERKKSQEALRRSEEQFSLLVQGVTDYAIYMLDPARLYHQLELRGRSASRATRPHEVVGQHFSPSTPRRIGTPGCRLQALETATREGRFEAEGWRVRKDGSRFFAQRDHRPDPGRPRAT